LGKAAQGIGRNGLKGANGSISKTLYAHKPLPDKELAGRHGPRPGKPLAFLFWEAASVEMLTEPIAYVSKGKRTPLLRPTLSYTCSKPTQCGYDLWKSSALCPVGLPDLDQLEGSNELAR
jgi:hypothetical protein